MIKEKSYSKAEKCSIYIPSFTHALWSLFHLVVVIILIPIQSSKDESQ